MVGLPIPSGNGGLKKTLIKTVTVTKSDYGAESGGLREAVIDISDIYYAYLATQDIFVEAYVSHYKNYYTTNCYVVFNDTFISKGHFPGTAISNNLFFFGVSDPASYFKKIEIYKEGQSHTTLDVEINSEYYNRMGSDETLYINFYTLD